MANLSLQEIEEQVKDVISKTLNIDKDKITPDKKLAEDLAIDSFGFVELAFALEDQAKIDIPDADLIKLKTIQDVISYIHSRLSTNKS
jgi:acyl carrier protein